MANLQGLQRSQGSYERRNLARKALIAGELSAQHWLLSGTNGIGGKQGRLGKLTGMSVLQAAPEMKISRPSSYSVKGLCTALAALSHELCAGESKAAIYSAVIVRFASHD